MSDFFVGFRPSPKRPEGLIPFRAEHTIAWSESPGAVFNFLTQRHFVESWLAPTTRFDSRQGESLGSSALTVKSLGEPIRESR